MVVAAVMAAEAALMVAGAEAPTVAAGPMEAGIPIQVEVTIAAASAANRPGAQRAG
jgi:hypothetical protein